MKYDAFISYSHERDRLLSKRLQQVIQSLGKPWYRRRNARVFRDESSLSADPSLWGAIVNALKNSTYLIVVASREAAKSKWVSREVEWWLENKNTENMLIILSDGDLVWDSLLGDFEKSSDSLPPCLFGSLRSEPLWIDLRNWRNSDKNVRNDVKFKALVSKIAAKLKNLPPEDLWSQELLQQRRNLLMVSVAGVVLLIMVFFSIRQSFFAIKNGAIAKLSYMETATIFGDYSLAFANATALKESFLTDEQVSKYESKLYEALWSNRLIKKIQLRDNETVRFESSTETPLITPCQIIEADESMLDCLTPLRHWQKPHGFANWSKDRRQISVALASDGNHRGGAEILISLKQCLESGDNDYRIDNQGDPKFFTAKDLLSNAPDAINARKNLRAPIYYIDDEVGDKFVMVEIVSAETLDDNSSSQEVLCVLVIDPYNKSIIDKYHPNLTLDTSSRIDRHQGFRRVSPNGMYYIEMESGGSLTLRSISNINEKNTLMGDLSFLIQTYNIENLIAFSKEGDSYIVSGNSQRGRWQQPFFVNSGHVPEGAVLKGHASEVDYVMISDSGKKAITIDSKRIARIWDLTDNPMGRWLRQSNTVVIADWIDVEDKGAENRQKELFEQLKDIDGIDSPNSVTEPECGRTVVRFGGNPSSGLISERDGESYIGLVDLNKKALIYSMPDSDHTGTPFFFCSAKDAADFALRIVATLDHIEPTPAQDYR